jgi:HSP20 family protein
MKPSNAVTLAAAPTSSGEVLKMAIDLWSTRPYPHGSFSTAIDRLFEQALTGYTDGSRDGGSTGFQSLPVNVWETGEGYQAALLAPGLDAQSINVTVHDDMLAIQAETRFETPQAAKLIWQEFGPAKFRRSLRLGSAMDPDKVEALYQDGILLVTIPKAEHAKPRQIQVQMGTPAAAKQ